jgi:hypothetical protein
MMEHLLGGFPNRPVLFSQEAIAERCDAKVAMLSDAVLLSAVLHPKKSA